MTGSLIVIPISRHVDYVERERLKGNYWEALEELEGPWTLKSSIKIAQFFLPVSQSIG